MKKETNNREKIKPGGMEGLVRDSSQPMSLTLDYDLYARYLDDPNLSESQKRGFLDDLWNVIVGFVDLGFGVHPLQQAAPNECGQDLKIGDLPPSKSDDVVNSGDQHPKDIFSRIAERPDCGHADRPTEGAES